MLEGAKLNAAAANDAENQVLVELSRADVETRRVSAMHRAASAMLGATALLLVLVLGLLIAISVGVHMLNARLGEISDAIGSVARPLQRHRCPRTRAPWLLTPHRPLGRPERRVGHPSEPRKHSRVVREHQSTHRRHRDRRRSPRRGGQPDGAQAVAAER